MKNNDKQPDSAYHIDMVPKTNNSGKQTFEMSEIVSQEQHPSKNDQCIDFSDCREMMQSAKNMSGGLSNINKEFKNLEGINNVSNNTPSSNLPQPQITQPIPFPFFRPHTNFIPSVGRKPRLIDPEINNFSSAEELKKWLDFLNIIYFYKKNYIFFLKELFQGGEFDQNNNRFKYNDLVVILESQQFIWELQLELPFGGWYNKNNLEYGLDLISLCIYHLKIGFGKLITMFSKIGENLYTLKRIRNKDEQPWIIQVKLPIISYDFRRIKIRGAKKVHESKYYTAYHFLQKIVEYWELLNGEIFSIYYTLCRPWNSQIYHSQMLNPHPPYSLYNLHLIHDNPDADIHFLDNERRCDRQEWIHDKDIPTTCFGGIKNLLEANLTPFRNRKIFIDFTHSSSEVLLIPKIKDKLTKAGVKEISYSFDSGRNWIPDVDFMKDPGKWGCNPEAENEKESKILYKTVPSGEKADGEDMENAILLYPIIEEGNIIWIFGEAKSFKSWIGYKIACALSIGNQIVGKWKSGDAVKVLYIDGEMRPNKIKRRLDLIKKGMNYEFEERPFDLYILKDSSGANIDTDVLSEEWQNNMASDLNKADVIIFDNFYSLTDNSQKSVKNAISWFGKLSQSGKTVIVLDHSNREGDLQGSISKERAADLVIKIEPHKTIKNRVTVSMPKPRDLSPKDTESFDLLMVFENDAFRMELVDSEGANDQPLSRRDFNIALAHELTKARGVDRDQILEMLQIKQATYYKYLKKDLPILTEKQKLLLKSEADRLLEALTS